MLLIIDFKLNAEEYANRGTQNDFPQIDRCPHCKGLVTLQRHGFYWRNAIEGESLYHIPICRLKCPSCKKTVSLLPDFLIPYYQYTLDTVLGKVEDNLIHQVITGCRQLVSFYQSDL
ncbi:DUF6431 domain-containing protein [Desulforamulus reducens]|uniref:DUF6431 domain-containing protein n=1 Tax=Desulforamulus reducens TaxID=59610 RepID=UPI0018DDC606|nr:DUF6431 domain-containing protein [Desulforamulus reducens]